ncbi:hypothetical protein CC1G_02198 [Coprinopsis cinerea okayama7|uniref:DUF6534 domain-containing protein n=1 Tax=Coprinopsis cinerea (strain Okayama-7 / 130 / ATCC MYA-4618 / FGSC 9003) TaxID=240176 RepID=A8NKI8_COPC7|nr:hypothetical protein CC1G_02198 [Coprinopsis cinerea okayama7\|eukprot:XP_001834462.2 hypothetical protein CC1G_02198 [Coprinopsis cinerea okayama7\
MAPSAAAFLVPTTIHERFGAGLIGALVNAMMYGLTTLQTYIFYLYYPKDSRGNKLLVAVVWVIDSVHTALVSWCIYYYLVTNYDNPEGLKTGHWTLFTSVLCNVIVACIVQSYFTYRIFQLASQRARWWLGGIIGLTVFAHFAFGVETVVFCFIKKDFARLHEFALIAATPFAITAVLSDILIAGSLCVLLHGSRTGFRNTNRLVTMLIIYAINRCILTSVVAVVEVIIFSLRPNAYWYLAIDFVIGKLYANSLLATLNSRMALAKATEINTTSNARFTSEIEFEDRQKRDSRGHVLSLNPESTTSGGDSISEEERSFVLSSKQA